MLNQSFIDIIIDRLLTEQYFIAEEQKWNPSEENRKKFIQCQKIINKLYKKEPVLLKEIMQFLNEDHMIKGFIPKETKKRILH